MKSEDEQKLFSLLDAVLVNAPSYGDAEIAKIHARTAINSHATSDVEYSAERCLRHLWEWTNPQAEIIKKEMKRVLNKAKVERALGIS